MPTKNYAYIAEEGHGALALVAICAVVLQFSLGTLAALPAWLALLLLFLLFRDPTQTPPSTPLAVVSPVHGRILEAGPARDPWLKRDAECVALKTGLFDLLSIYTPLEAKIVEQWSSIPDPSPGELNPPHSSAFYLRTDEGDDIILVISRGEWGGRLSFDYGPGERIGHGRRVGFATFGCTARVYLPAGSVCVVAAGDKVTAGSVIIARLVHLTRMGQTPVGRGPVSAVSTNDS